MAISPTFILEQPSIVVDTLLGSLILSTVVDDEHLTAPATPVLHGVWPNGSNLTQLLRVSLDGGLPRFSRGPGVAILPKLVL